MRINIRARVDGIFLDYAELQMQMSSLTDTHRITLVRTSPVCTPVQQNTATSKFTQASTKVPMEARHFSRAQQTSRHTAESLSTRESHPVRPCTLASLSLLLSLNQNRPVARAQRHARAHKNGASKRKGRHGARPKGRPGWRSASTWEAGAAGLASTNAPRPTQMTSSEPRWRCPLICVLPS